MKKSGSMMHAVFAAIITGILMMPALGIHLHRQNYQLQAENNWQYVLIAMLIVFVFQLLRSHLVSRLPKFSFPVKEIKPLQPRTHILVMGLLFIVLVAWSLVSKDQGDIDLATLVLIYVMLGLGLNIVVGFAGLLDLGFVGFYAVGAYTYAMLNHWFGLGFWEILPLCGLFSAIFGFILGFPVLRLRGDYLAIVTLGFGEIIRILLNNLSDWTGGPDGISSIPKPSFLGHEFSRRATGSIETFHHWMGWSFSPLYGVVFIFLATLVMAFITYAICTRLLRMPIGRAWEALREDEIACRSLGLNPTRIKLSAFTLGAMFAGFAGAFFAARQGLVTPESFSFIESAMILAIVVLGGMGSQIGVILAAVILTLLPELFRDLSQYRMLLFGFVMVLMMVWRPQGLLPMKRPQMELPK